MAAELTLRPMAADDVPAVVSVHLDSFPGFFLSFLGPAFLGALYRGILRDEAGVAVVAEVKGEIIGFAAGTQDQAGFYRRLLRRRLIEFVVASIRPCLRRPAVIPRMVRALRRPTDVGATAAVASLMSIAVRPGSGGRGVGQQLVEAFCAALRQEGVEAVCLETDREGNERVNEFYSRLGFQLTRSYATPEGRPMNEYVLQLTIDE